jgi:hypothetical protein
VKVVRHGSILSPWSGYWQRKKAAWSRWRRTSRGKKVRRGRYTRYSLTRCWGKGVRRDRCDPSSLKEKLIKIGAKLVSHGRYVAFQMAEVAIPRHLVADILRLIAELRPPPVPSTA